MSEFHPVVLQRPLLFPPAEKIKALQHDLINTVGRFMPTDHESVRFMRPDAAAISIVGGNIIEMARKTAHGHSELPYLSAEQIADRAMEAVAKFGKHDRPVATTSHANHCVGRLDRRYFGTQLTHSDIVRERFIGTSAVRALGGIRPGRQAEQPHSVAWISFRVELPEGLEDALTEASQSHIPKDTEFLFGRLTKLDTANAPSPYI